MKRLLNACEKTMIKKVAERLSERDGAQLLEDLARAFVAAETSDRSRVTFGIYGYVRPPYRGQRSFGVEGMLKDNDGTDVSVDLFADDNGRLLELELIRWGHGDLIKPDWHTLKL
ncbi:hypothetical protein [Methylomonas sp. UP202]|uniref:DUF6984 family protein n=1 Tax=Methylomonas sp. UP202 TaxID=3040943 RepID=UPI002479DEDF|nr:hypothetical protein [Methylomonas sp. UP202]WGS87484.1 hypothetical protein QC632_06935 [Methylomonas sp. UP202]